MWGCELRSFTRTAVEPRLGDPETYWKVEGGSGDTRPSVTRPHARRSVVQTAGKLLPCVTQLEPPDPHDCGGDAPSKYQGLLSAAYEPTFDALHLALAKSQPA